MNAAPAPRSLTTRPAQMFTAGSALRWLGHDCPNHRCWEPIADVAASVWFIRRGPHFRLSPAEALLLLDLAQTGEPPARIDAIFNEVDCCTRNEAIHIRPRHPGENRHDVIALAWRHSPAAVFG
jgi:hypothetical protein